MIVSDSNHRLKDASAGEGPACAVTVSLVLDGAHFAFVEPVDFGLEHPTLVNTWSHHLALSVQVSGVVLRLAHEASGNFPLLLAQIAGLVVSEFDTSVIETLIQHIDSRRVFFKDFKSHCVLFDRVVVFVPFAGPVDEPDSLILFRAGDSAQERNDVEGSVHLAE